MNAFVKPDLPEFYLTRSAQVAESPMLTRLRDEREQTLEFVERTVGQAETDQRDLSDTEKETLVRSKTRVAELDAQIKPLAEFDALKRANADSSARFRPTGTPAAQTGAQGLGAQLKSREYEYKSVGEFMADVAMSSDNPDAAHRLESAGLTRNSEGFLTRAAGDIPTSGLTGTMPAPIVGSILNNIDASRPFIASIGALDMGSISGKTFSRPVITQNTLSAEQTAELGALGSRSLVIEDVDFTKKTRGASVMVPRQAIDWTSPAVWGALMQDIQDSYAIDSEEAVVAAFSTSIPTTGQDVELTTASGATPSLGEIIAALYGAASAVYTSRKSLSSLKIWQSVDQWSLYGAVIDTAAANSGSQTPQSQVNGFVPSLLQTPRIVVPSLAAGTTIVGPADRVEVYEQRIGFLSAIKPSVLGVEMAYGGYVASGTLLPAAFRRIVNEA